MYMKPVRTIQAAKDLLTWYNFNVTVQDDIDSGWEELSIVVKGRSFVVFTTENTDHSFTSADKVFFSAGEILDIANEFKERRIAESLEAKNSNASEF
jgi:hypothetical protein